jgi:hypothetical protein
LKESKLFAEPAFASPMNLDPDAGIDDRAEMLFQRSMEVRVSFARRKYLHPQSHIGPSRFLDHGNARCDACSHGRTPPR